MDYHTFMQDSQLERWHSPERFIRLLVEFVAVCEPTARATWRKKHPHPEGMENWEHAMLGQWDTISPIDQLGIHSTVRAYMDEWINTGFRRDGSEMPHERSFRRNYPGIEAKTRACTALTNMIDRIRPKMSFGAKGGITVHPRGLFSPNAEVLAEEIFFEFYCSEWRFRVLRCNNCRTIVLPRGKPRERYLRGWYCNRCLKKVSARIATVKAREQKRDQWLALTLNAFIQYEAKTRKDERSSWIAGEINKKLRLVDHIKRNRVSSIGKLFDAGKAAGMTSEAAIVDAIDRYKKNPKRGRER